MYPGGGPGMSPPKGPPGAGEPESGGQAGPRVFTSDPKYRTVKPDLKALLNAMEAEGKPIFNFVGKVQTSRMVEILFGAGLDFGDGKFKPSLPPGTKGQETIPKAPYIAITLYELSPTKCDLRFAVDCDDDDQAKEMEKLLQNFVPLIAAAVQDEVGLPIRAGGGANSGGFPGRWARVPRRRGGHVPRDARRRGRGRDVPRHAGGPGHAQPRGPAGR